MRKELDEKLCRDFPKLYQDRNAPMTDTAMCWGFECGDGWFNLIYELSSYIQGCLGNRARFKPRESVIEETGIQFVATQIKEKFGQLRIYFKFEEIDVPNKNEEYTQEVAAKIQGAVDFAELLSGTICESCGVPGSLRGREWIFTRCDSCCEKDGVDRCSSGS